MGYVYFIEMERPRLIKIGYASDVDERLSNLQTACPFELSVLDVFIGTKEDERVLHKMLKPHRYRREWFRPTDDVFDLMEDLEQYRRETFDRTIFDPAVHATTRAICDAIGDVPITGFLATTNGR